MAKLALHYQQSGNTAAAAQVKDDLRRQLQRLGKSARAEVLVRQIDDDTRKPDALKPAQKIITTYDPSSTGSVATPPAALVTPVKPTTEKSLASLVPTTHITGRVLTPQSAPIAGVTVELTADGRMYRAVAGQGGAFDLEIPRGSGDVTVHVVHSGYREFTARMKASEPLQIKLAPVNTKMMQQLQKPPTT